MKIKRVLTTLLPVFMAVSIFTSCEKSEKSGNVKLNGTKWEVQNKFQLDEYDDYKITFSKDKVEVVCIEWADEEYGEDEDYIDIIRASYKYDHPTVVFTDFEYEWGDGVDYGDGLFDYDDVLTGEVVDKNNITIDYFFMNLRLKRVK